MFIQVVSERRRKVRLPVTMPDAQGGTLLHLAGCLVEGFDVSTKASCLDLALQGRAPVGNLDAGGCDGTRELSTDLGLCRPQGHGQMHGGRAEHFASHPRSTQTILLIASADSLSING